jgi:8-oxo-dGTP pyrophosphatase MutT (NUDIX family)
VTRPATDPVPVRDAATVVLLRDTPGGIEAWLLTRGTQMVFAAGMSVFPGGRVDPGDADLPWSGRPAAAFAEEFGCSTELARALVAAAVRETFEETGVLLTVPPPAGAGLSEARAEVEAGRCSFGRLLCDHDLRVDVDALRPWARWVTPLGEVRRYDTRLFVGALPAGACPADVTTESSTAGWVPLATALEQGRRGVRGLLPPTAATLASLLPFRTVADALAGAPDRSLEPVRPRFVEAAGGGAAVALPDGSVVPVPRMLRR